jgi:hypothetical protein
VKVPAPFELIRSEFGFVGVHVYLVRKDADAQFLPEKAGFQTYGQENERAIGVQDGRFGHAYTFGGSI